MPSFWLALLIAKSRRKRLGSSRIVFQKGSDPITDRRKGASDERGRFSSLPSLRHAIRHAALCHWLPSMKRHPHQRRIPGAALRKAERRLQRLASRLRRCEDFDRLHEEVVRSIGPIPRIGDLKIYVIAHRIGAYLGKPPRLVYLHRGTRLGARHLGFSGASLDPNVLPPAFSRLSPEEIGDCLCIYKSELAGLSGQRRHLSRCVTVRPGRQRVCSDANGFVGKSC
jgi:hypothetical protein